MSIKKSYGIICCKTDKLKGFQIILIKKPVTYYFCEFVSGRYKKNDDVHLKKLFDNMTYFEKMDILSLNFNILWYRIYKVDPDQSYLRSCPAFISKQYYKKKDKFDICFLRDNGERLKKIIINRNL